jgi:hypothetical protein
MTGTKTATRKCLRNSERIPMHARLQLSTEDGKPAAPLARCTNVGLGGIRVIAAEGLAPGTRVHLDLQLPSGRVFHAQGRIAWLQTTLRPSLLSTPTGRDDDARFGVAFEDTSTEHLLPIARLFAAREAERNRARRIRRLHTLRIHA